MNSCYRTAIKAASLLKATLSIALLTGCGSNTPTVTGASHLYVPHITAVNSNPQTTINGYPVTANGVTTPDISVTLPAGFVGISVAYGPTGKLYVGGGYEDAPGEILVYAPGATGAATPVAVYTGDTPGTFVFPLYLAVNSQGALFVGSTDATLEVFSPDAKSGDLPAQYITTLAENDTSTYGIGADSAGNVYVADYENQVIDVFAAGATGNATPVRTITGTSTNSFVALGAITADDDGNVYVANYNENDDPFDAARPWAGPLASAAHGPLAAMLRNAHANNARPHPMNTSNVAPAAPTGIYVFAAGASGNATPTAFISGTATNVNEPEGMAVDKLHTIYYSDNEGGSPAVMVFPAGTNGNAAASNAMTSADITSLEGPLEVAVY